MVTGYTNGLHDLVIGSVTSTRRFRVCWEGASGTTPPAPPPSLLPCTSECNLPTCLHGEQTHPAHHSSRLACSHRGASLHRSTDADRASACLAAIPEEGGICVAAGLLFSCHH
ncbi:unnamed protein product [Pleuronectes platessa]|uniref:Uncharacterized protein n=1 Tax=Pleuronectes platessa TaxID=8262 RepID=A0A9N7UN79_PLEPL|nr:unnamed protein product [Pleuronectes platessa]